MAHFTEDQLKELETIFGLKRKHTLPVRDGFITDDRKVWWRSADGPEFVDANDHWANIESFPDAYQLKPPHHKIVYVD